VDIALSVQIHTAFNNLFDDGYTLFLAELPSFGQHLVKRASCTVFGNNHEFFLLLFFNESQNIGVIQFTEDLDFVIYEVLADRLLVKLVVDDFNADGLFLSVRSLIDFGSVSLADFVLDVKGFSFQLEFPHSSFNY